DNGTYTVTLRVSLQTGGQAVSESTATTTVTVANVLPEVTITGPDEGIAYEETSLILDITDVSPLDLAAPFSATIDWGDDSGIEDFTVAPRGVSHTYEAAGDYTVVVTARDKDGGIGEARKTIHVQWPAELEVHSMDPAPFGAVLLDETSMTLRVTFNKPF